VKKTSHQHARLLLGWLDSLFRFIGIVAVSSKSLISSGRRATVPKFKAA